MRAIRFLAAGAVAAALLTAAATKANAWSLNPFASDKTETKAKPAPKPEKKVSTAKAKSPTQNKGFFGGLGEALGIKKSPPKKTANPYATARASTSVRQPTSSKTNQTKPSWFSSLFRKEEPKKPKSPSDWMNLPRVE